MLAHPSTPDQRQRTETIAASAEALLGILDDILDFSRIEAGMLHFETVDFDLPTLLGGVVQLLAGAARQKSIELITDIDTDVPRSLRGDPTRLRQILMNLAGNAVKFTERGRVAVRAALQHDSNGKVGLRFFVTDTGIGISEDDRHRLFRPFSQANVSTTREYGGTGLGLAISKQLVELMGGEIGVESTPGSGSTFWFSSTFDRSPKVFVAQDAENCGSMTRIAASESTDPQHLLPLVSALRVLLVEDSRVNQLVALGQLERLGYEADVVSNGREAVEAAAKASHDVVLMDCQMPQMDGYDATAEIRRTEGATRHVHIIAMTAYAMAGDRERCLASGMDDYICKPFKIESLRGALSRIDGKLRDAPPTADSEDAEREHALVDLAWLREAGGDDKGDLRNLLNIYFAEMDLGLRSLREAVSAGSIGEVEKAAHRCRGSSFACGMQAMGTGFRALENAARAGTLAGAGEAMALIEMELERLKPFLEERLGLGLTEERTVQ
jgi:CheY-like chemotaxis protein